MDEKNRLPKKPLDVANVAGQALTAKQAQEATSGSDKGDKIDSSLSYPVAVHLGLSSCHSSLLPTVTSKDTNKQSKFALQQFKLTTHNIFDISP